MAGVPPEQMQLLYGHDSVPSTDRYVKSRWHGTVAPHKVAMDV
jgi:hypothetical protein